MNPLHLHLLLFLIAVSVFFFWVLRQAGPKRAWVKSLAVIATIALTISYLRVGAWTDDDFVQTTNTHDFFHYYIGSKYYPELGHSSLYDCTWLALKELESGATGAPPDLVRRLDDFWKLRDTTELLNRSNALCLHRFSADRWQEFRSDIQKLNGLVNRTDYPWRDILTDAGNNSPPTWNAFATPVSNLIPLTEGNAQWFGVIDEILLLALIPLAMFWAFGLAGACVYLIALAIDPFALFGWNSGSFLRLTWFAAFGIAIPLMARRYWAAAGFLLGLSAAFRIFPVVFAAAALIPLVAKGKYFEPYAAIRLALGIMAGIGLPLLLSFLIFGTGSWIEFYHEVMPRVSFSFGNVLSFFKVAVAGHVTEFPSFRGGDLALLGQSRWIGVLNGVIQEHRILAEMVRISCLFLACVAATRQSPTGAAMLVGSAIVFLFARPFAYYYIFLCLWVPVFIAEREQWEQPNWILRTLFMFALMGLGYICSTPLLDTLGIDEGFAEYYTLMSIALFLVLLAIIFTYLRDAGLISIYFKPPDTPFVRMRLRAHPAVILGGGALVLGSTGMVVQARPTAPAPSNYFSAEQLRVEAPDRTHAFLRPATKAWRGSRYTEFALPAGSGPLSFPLAVNKPGVYRLSVFLVPGSMYCDAVVSFAGVTARADLHEPGNNIVLEPRRILLGSVKINSVEQKLAIQPDNCPDEVRRVAIEGIQIDPI